jgi:hypothetical protein
MIYRRFRFSIFFLCFSSIVSFLFACKKDTSWNSNWLAPIVNDTLSLKNLVNDSTLSTGSSSYYELDLDRTIFDFGIEDIVEIPDTQIVQSFSIATSSINVPPGFSFVNEIEEHTLNVPDIQLKKIRVSQGVIKIKVYNPLITKAFFTVILPGVSKNGNLFQENYQVVAGSPSNPSFATAILDISGYEIDLTGQDGDAYNLLQSQLIVSSDPAGPSITVTNSQQFNLEANFENIKVDYARGYFGNKVFEDVKDVNIDLLNAVASGTIDLPNPSIQFEVTNGLKLDARILLNAVSNTNYAGNTVSLSGNQIGTPVYIDPATGSWNSIVNSVETVTFNGSNSNVELYLENLGKKHSIDYRIELNPWGNSSGGWNEVFPNSRLTVKLKAQMPLSIGADGLTLRDTFNFELDQNLDKTHIESGILVLNAENAFPFSSKIKLSFMDEFGVVIHTITGSEDIGSSLYGTFHSNSGLWKNKSQLELLFPEALIKDLAKIRKVIVQTEFNTPDPGTTTNQQQSIPVGAFLAVKLKAKFNLKVIY